MNNEKTFATLIRSDSNGFLFDVLYQMAHYGIENVASFSPMFLHGESHTGKTHLAKAFCTELVSHHPDATVVYATVSDIINHIRKCLHTDSMDHFEDRYTIADLFIIDNFQELYSMPSTQFLLFQLIQAMVQQSKAVIILSTKHYSDFIEDKALFVLLEAGLAMKVYLPDTKAKTNMARQMAEDLELMPSEDELQQIAESCATYVDIEQMIRV